MTFSQPLSVVCRFGARTVAALRPRTRRHAAPWVVLAVVLVAAVGATVVAAPGPSATAATSAPRPTSEVEATTIPAAPTPATAAPSTAAPAPTTPTTPPPPPPPPTEAPAPSSTSPAPTTAPPVPATDPPPETAPPPPATSPPPVDPNTDLGPGFEQRRGEAALARITYPWRDLGWSVVFAPHRPGYLGIASRTTRTVTVWVRPDQTVHQLAITLAHEIGHAIDFTVLSDADRDAYRAMRGGLGGSWWGCAACDDYSTPAGDFAEVFAYWQIGPGDFRSQLAGPPGSEVLAAMGALTAPG